MYSSLSGCVFVWVCIFVYVFVYPEHLWHFPAVSFLLAKVTGLQSDLTGSSCFSPLSSRDVIKFLFSAPEPL